MALKAPAMLAYERDRLAYIDGLRACAALAVVCCHTALITPIWSTAGTWTSGRASAWLGHALFDGAHGVDLFFVLSGFCLAYPTLARLHADGRLSFDVVRFAIHRIVRVLPPYYIASALLLGVAAVSFATVHRFSAPGTAPLHLRDVVAQLLLLDRATVLASPPYWTLVVEFRWYLLFPMLLLVWMRAPRAFGLLAAAVAVGYWFTRLHNLDLGVLPAFMLGIVAADLRVRNHALCRYALPLALACVVLALALERVTVMPNEFGVDVQFFIWQTNPGWHLVAFFVVLAAGEASWLRSFLSNPVLTFGGIASYSIYLVHYPIVMFAGPRLLRGSSVGGYLATVALAVAGGVVFWYTVERWFCTRTIRARAYTALAPAVAGALAWLRVPPVLEAGMIAERSSTADAVVVVLRSETPGAAR